MKLCTCQEKVDSKKEWSRKAQFGSVLNWAFVAQSGVPPPVVEVGYILVQEDGNILSMVKIEIKIEFFLHPTVQSLNNWIICRSSPSRHGAKYVIMAVGLAKSLGRVDSSLVGVEDYLGLLLFLFSCQPV